MERCRICDGAPLHPAFTAPGFRGAMASYAECAQCGSLMCLAPSWLPEAYRTAKDSDDSGAPARAERIHAIVAALAAHGVAARGGRWLDYGAGAGLLSALLGRDGYEVTAYDPMRPGMEEEPAGRYDGASCVEVIEHLLDPRRVLRSIASLLAEGACLIVATNFRPQGSGADWPYLAAALGQHITFASPRGFDLLVQDSGLRWACSLRPEALPDLEVHLLVRGPSDVSAIDAAAAQAGFCRIGA